MVNSSLDQSMLYNQLMKPINSFNTASYWLDDKTIFYFLKVFKKNVKVFEFLDPIIMAYQPVEESIKSIFKLRKFITSFWKNWRKKTYTFSLFTGGKITGQSWSLTFQQIRTYISTLWNMRSLQMPVWQSWIPLKKKNW